MVDYISRQAAIEEIRNDPMGGLNYKRILTDIPAADVVPVVRCRDCRYLHKDFSNGIYPNKKWCSRITEYMKPDDFCSYGERKE